jgi:eukaryotic-like serine/threonine-protein kinase
MSLRTPCPHPIELRMFVQQHSAQLPETESVRAHLEHCSVCRALTARFAAEKPVQHTLADDAFPEHPLSDGHDNRDPPSRVVEAGAESLHTISGLETRNVTSPAKATLSDVNLKASPAAVHANTSDVSSDDDLAYSFQVVTPAVRVGGDETSASDRRTGSVPAITGDESASALKSAGSSAQTLADHDAARPREPGRSADPWRGLRARSAGAAGATVRSEADSGSRSDSKSGSILGTAHTIQEQTPGQRKPSEPAPTVALQRAADDSSQLGASDSGAKFTIGVDSLDGRLNRSALEHVALPGYEILSELGRGGMGVVYKARHRRLHRLVALKMVLAGQHVGPVGLARFRAEAEAVAKLSHPNIVQIYETGEHEGRPFFSLEFADGGSLDQRLSESPTSPRGAAQLIETLARTMHVAHEHGIVHRDLKPANILLAKLGKHSSITKSRELDSLSLPADHWSRSTTPKIADFGLAKHLDDDSSNTKTGAILGTPSYMAPEQAGGKTREIGPPCDIYALGAILYELLVGRPPFRAGNPIDTIRQVMDQEPVPPRQLEPRVPNDLETICLKCLEKDPLRRYPTALALADDLQRFSDGHPIEARPTPAWERAWKWARRRPAIVALVALSTLAALCIVLLIVWHNVSLQGKLDVAIERERRARNSEMDARREIHLTQLQQESQKLYDSARVAVAASDWATARLDLEKALTTIGSEARLDAVREPAEALLKRVTHELRVEADRRASAARIESFGSLRDEAQFLGTLYTGMDLAANLAAARASTQKALAVYGVKPGVQARPAFDDYLSAEQKAEIQRDCSQLLLILAETEAQSTTGQKPALQEQYLRKALSYLEHARQMGAPSRAFHLRQARYLGLLGDKAQASKAEQAAGGVATDDVIDHFLMADELYRREQFAQAIKEFDLVLERKPGHFWAQYINALCLLRQQRPAEAKALLSACLAQRSDFVWLYLLRGFAQEELKAWDAARADFEKAAQMRLDDNARYVLFVDRGVLNYRTGKLDLAVKDLEAAINLKPTAYQAYVNLAPVYRGQQKLDLALKQLERAIELEPKLAHLYRLRARLDLERNEPDLALADFEQAIVRENSASPYRVDDNVECGRLLLNRGEFARALAAFDAALALDSDHAAAQRLRAEALFRLRRFREVVEAFDRYLERGKPLESVYKGRGLARAELGQYPNAIEDFTKALELHPTSAVQAFRGWTHLVVDAPKLALRDFELAIELDAKNGDAYNGRGFARARLGEYREAAQDAALALRIGPESHRLFYNAARIYAQCPSPYPTRALELVGQALSSLPAADRPQFWKEHILKDQTLVALHRHPLFNKLESDFNRGQ